MAEGDEQRLTAAPRILFACIPVFAIETEGKEIEVSVEGDAWVGVDGVGDSEKEKRDEGGYGEHDGRRRPG